MKPAYRGATWASRLGRIAVACGLFLALTAEVSAEHEGKPHPKSYSSDTLQQLKEQLETPWLKGKIVVFIRQALVYGQQRTGDTYCSPWVGAANSSNRPIAELFVGINYELAGAREQGMGDGAIVGSTFSEFRRIPIGGEEIKHFYRVQSSHCLGLRGRLRIVRCAYVGGEDCTADVQAIQFGSIPLESMD